MTNLEQAVTEEIESLHRFFVGWFSGHLPESSFDNEFIKRFSADFLLIPPSGTLLNLDAFAQSVKTTYSSNPDFKIAIRAVQIQRVFADYVLATYEEWQRNALASKPPNNGRLATVLFRQTERLEWLHVHETWLPTDVMSVGPYDF